MAPRKAAPTAWSPPPGEVLQNPAPVGHETRARAIPRLMRPAHDHDRPTPWRLPVAALLTLAVAGCGTQAASVQSTTAAPRPASTAGAAPAFDPQSASFTSAAVGWAWGPGAGWLASGSGPGVLARSSDGGRTWKVVPTAGIKYAEPGFGPGVWRVSFADRRDGYLLGSRSYVTSDAGVHWRALAAPGPILALQSGAGQVYAAVLRCANLNRCDTAGLFRARLGATKLVAVGPAAVSHVHG